MNIAISSFRRSLSAEFIKIKRTPILYISLVGGLFVSGIIFILHLFNADDFAKEGQNPWILYFDIGFMLTSMVLLVPYIILTASSLTHFEHQSSAWKYLYSLPQSRGNIYFSKLILMLLLTFATYFIYIFAVFISGYIVDFIHPIYGFRDYSPDIGDWASRLTHSFISLLGILGLHYWLSTRWKNFIIPVGIGLLGFIVAMIFLITNKYEYAMWAPYAYPGLIGAEWGITGERTEFVHFGWFSKMEILSVVFFVVFTIMGFVEEKLSNVK